MKPGNTTDTRPPIIIGYDGTPNAVRAVESAATLFPGQPAVIVYAWPSVDPNRIHTTPVELERRELIEEVRVATRLDAQAIAQEGTTLALRAGLPARPLAIEAPSGAAEAIERIAATETAAAIVVGRRNRTPFRSHLADGVSQSLVEHRQAPVVIV